jgi:hypothetical protein
MRVCLPEVIISLEPTAMPNKTWLGMRLSSKHTRSAEFLPFCPLILGICKDKTAHTPYHLLHTCLGREVLVDSY